MNKQPALNLIDDIDSLLSVNPEQPSNYASAIDSAASMLRMRRAYTTPVKRDDSIDPDTQQDMRRRDAIKHRVSDRKEVSERVPFMKVGQYFTVGYKDAQSARNIVFRHRMNYAPHKVFETETFRYSQSRYLKITRVK